MKNKMDRKGNKKNEMNVLEVNGLYFKKNASVYVLLSCNSAKAVFREEEKKTLNERTG